MTIVEATALLDRVDRDAVSVEALRLAEEWVDSCFSLTWDVEPSQSDGWTVFREVFPDHSVTYWAMSDQVWSTYGSGGSPLDVLFRDDTRVWTVRIEGMSAEKAVALAMTLTEEGWDEVWTWNSVSFYG